MAKWVLSRPGTWDYPTLGFRATDGDICDEATAPDGYWSLAGDQGAAETVDRYGTSQGSDFVETPNGYVAAFSTSANRGEFMAPSTWLAIDAVDDALGTHLADTATAAGASLSATIATTQTGLDFAPLIATETAVTTVRPIGSIGDGYVYGTHNTTGGLYRSTDGVTWTQLPNLTGNPVTIHDANDGEVLVNRSGTLQKSTGWATNPLTATFATVATATTGASFIQSDIDVYDNIVLLAEYAVPREPSRWVRVSTDHGATFANVLDLDVLHPGQSANTHWHAVTIDRWHVGPNPRLYVSHGDGPRGVYYSDDLGATWTLLRNDWQPMPMVATENGIVVSTDANDPDGVWLIPRANTATRELLYRIPAPYWSNSLLGFGLKAHRDDYTGTIYITFRVDTLATIGKNMRGMIFATDGYRASLVYESGLAAATGQNVTWDSPATLPDGSLLVSYLEPGSTTARRLVRTEPAKRGDTPTYRLNDGNALTGTALDRASVVIGPETVGTGRSVLIGTDLTQVSTDASTDFRQVLIGASAVGGNQSVGIGQDVSAEAQRAVAVGMTAVVNGSDGVALGANTIAYTSGVAIGKAATNGTSVNSVAIGMNSACTGNNTTTVGFGSSSAALAVALGYTASASGSSAVALGAAAVASTSNSIAIGGSASAANTSSVAIGASVKAGTNSVLVGAAIGDRSAYTNGTVVGANAVISGNHGAVFGASGSAAAQGTALGVSSNAGHSASVALGYSTATTLANQVAIGARHIFGTELASDPTAPAANGWELYAKDNGSGKTGLFVRFATGAVQQIAIEP